MLVWFGLVRYGWAAGGIGTKVCFWVLFLLSLFIIYDYDFLLACLGTINSVDTFIGSEEDCTAACPEGDRSSEMIRWGFMRSDEEEEEEE